VKSDYGCLVQPKHETTDGLSYCLDTVLPQRDENEQLDGFWWPARAALLSHLWRHCWKVNHFSLCLLSYALHQMNKCGKIQYVWISTKLGFRCAWSRGRKTS